MKKVNILIVLLAFASVFISCEDYEDYDTDRGECCRFYY